MIIDIMLIIDKTMRYRIHKTVVVHSFQYTCIFYIAHLRKLDA